LKNEKKNMEAKCELGVMITQAREIWQVGEDEIMSRGALACAGAAGLMLWGCSSSASPMRTCLGSQMEALRQKCIRKG